MHLLLRIVRFLALLAFRLVLRLLAFLVRLLLPVLRALLRVLRNLALEYFNAIVFGPRQYIDGLGADWTRRLIRLGADQGNIDGVYNLCRVLVAGRMVLGLIIASFLAAVFTALILRVVFGIHF